jgi:hypothetical protein
MPLATHTRRASVEGGVLAGVLGVGFAIVAWTRRSARRIGTTTGNTIHSELEVKAKQLSADSELRGWARAVRQQAVVDEGTGPKLGRQELAERRAAAKSR